MVPYLFVEQPTELAGFLKAAFDAEELGCTRAPDGRVANLRLRIGTTSFMLGGLSAGVGAMPGSHRLYVEDADAAFAKALACGATKDFPPVTMPYGDRMGAVTDPCGNAWFICTRSVHQPYDPAPPA